MTTLPCLFSLLPTQAFNPPWGQGPYDDQIDDEAVAEAAMELVSAVGKNPMKWQWCATVAGSRNPRRVARGTVDAD